jgi:hypothetical protein
MDPIVQVLIDRIESLAVDKAGLKGQLAGLRQDVASAESQADRVTEQLRELRSRNTRLVEGLQAVCIFPPATFESLVEAIKDALRHAEQTSSDEGGK